MTNRERWIVYPLLFYALVMGFKATYQDPLEFRCRTIECQQLKVKMINGSAALAMPQSRSTARVIEVSERPRDEGGQGSVTEKPGPAESP